MSGWRSRFAWSIAAWLAVGVFWFALTRNFHPTFGLAMVVTCSLVAAFALAVYVNHLYLIPHFFRVRRFGAYAVLLVVVMVSLTAAALAVIRTAYICQLGPDPDPNGLYVHFGIDLFGMVMHVAAAAVVLSIVRMLSRGAKE
jgi:hypothetical protein